MMDFYKQKLTLDWQGVPLSVTYEPVWMGTDCAHIEVHSPMVAWSEGSWTGKARLPLPITESGYLSIFVPAEVLAEADGPLSFLTIMLDIEAQRPEWIAAQAKRQQLNLF